MTLRLNGTSSGFTEIDAPAAAGSNKITLPTSNGSAEQFLKNSGTAGELEFSSMVETSTGVGVGTTSPDAPIAVQRPSNNQGISGGISLKGQDGTTQGGIGTDGVNTNNLQILAAQGIDFHTGNTDGTTNIRTTIDSSGRLLVGTNSSQGGHLFQVKGGDASLTKLVAASGGNAVQMLRFRVHNANNTSQDASLAGISAETVSSWGGQLTFHTKDNNGSPNETLTERARISHAGFASFSTNISDSDRYNTGNYHAIHSDKSNDIALSIENSSASPYGMLIDFSDAAPNNNSNYYLRCKDSSTDTRLYIWSDGDVDNHDNSYSGLSDLKLKQDIVDAGSQWDDIKNLRVRKFKFKSDVAAYGDEAKTLIGVVAQETELVSPGLVKESPDVDEENNDLGTTTKSVRYSVLYMKAVKALQEAQTRIETLETQNTAQQTQIDDLLARVTALEAA